MPLERIEGHSILPYLVVGGGAVIDCGANVGVFTRVMVERFGCRVLAIEASPEIFPRLSKLPGVQACNVAVSGEDGPVRLAINADSTRTAIRPDAVAGDGTIEVPGRKLEGVVSDAGLAGEIEVLKLDIEGAELSVIDSLGDDFILRVGQITVEFHDFLGYHTTQEAEQRISHITALGFRELYWGRRRNMTDVLLVNGRRLRPFRHAIEQGVVRPARALVRRIAAPMSTARRPTWENA
jgi:FkbM family methyltransferase